jgi:hypothetical protein
VTQGQRFTALASFACLLKASIMPALRTTILIILLICGMVGLTLILSAHDTSRPSLLGEKRCVNAAELILGELNPECER